MNTMVLGSAGGTGSGKTTRTKRLKERFGDQISVISHDNYYKRQDELTYEQRCLTNYDHPNAFETELMVEHIKALKAGETVLCPVYDFSQHNRSDDFIQIHPAPVILVEGILIFASPELCGLMDIKVFVDTDADVRILRRIVRDVKKRGRTLDSVVTQYLTTVKPMHEQFVEPSKRRADLIIPEGGGDAHPQAGEPSGQRRKRINANEKPPRPTSPGTAAFLCKNAEVHSSCPSTSATRWPSCCIISMPSAGDSSWVP